MKRETLSHVKCWISSKDDAARSVVTGVLNPMSSGALEFKETMTLLALMTAVFLFFSNQIFETRAHQATGWVMVQKLRRLKCKLRLMCAHLTWSVPHQLPSWMTNRRAVNHLMASFYLCCVCYGAAPLPGPSFDFSLTAKDLHLRSAPGEKYNFNFSFWYLALLSCKPPIDNLWA